MSRSSHVSLTAAALLGLAVLAPPLEARSRPLTVPEMSREGERIVAGQVVSKASRWGEGRKMIWTDYTVRVEETWKGAPSGTLVVSLAGGTVDGRSIQVSHVPHLAVGGTYVLVLYGNEHLYGSPIVGSEQGLFREVTLEGTSGSGEAILVSESDTMLSLGAGGRLVPGERLAEGSSARHARRAEAARPAGDSTWRGMAAPVFRDGSGTVVSPKPVRRLRGIDGGSPTPLTRQALRTAVKAALESTPEVTK
ncbi:MAG: hypothetical protein JNK60_01095 [Acidobacteria bacterium]|nr:hypothetical protein [Acidobacteriota bacterium]